MTQSNKADYALRRMYQALPAVKREGKDGKNILMALRILHLAEKICAIKW